MLSKRTRNQIYVFTMLNKKHITSDGISKTLTCSFTIGHTCFDFLDFLFNKHNIWSQFINFLTKKIAHSKIQLLQTSKHFKKKYQASQNNEIYHVALLFKQCKFIGYWYAFNRYGSLNINRRNQLGQVARYFHKEIKSWRLWQDN